MGNLLRKWGDLGKCRDEYSMDRVLEVSESGVARWIDVFGLDYGAEDYKE